MMHRMAWGQATPSMQQMLGGVRRVAGKKRRKAKAKRAKRKAKVGATAARRAGKPKRLVKGSAAAKAWMAKIRKKRRK